MKIDLFAIIMKAFSSPAVIKMYLFFFFWLVVIILIKALSDRALKKFNPKPLKTSTIAIVLVFVVVLMLITWVSLNK